MNQRYVTASKKSYETVVRNVQRSLIRAKKDVWNRAEANGISEEARPYPLFLTTAVVFIVISGSKS